MLEREPDPDLREYFEGTAHLKIPETMILPHQEYLVLGNEGNDSPLLDVIRDHAAERMDGYVTDSVLTKLAKKTGKRSFSSKNGSRKGNNKYLLHCFLEEAGLPAPRTEIAESTSDVGECLDRLEKAGFSAVVKAPMGASGIGLIKVPSLADREEIANSVPEHFFTEGPCLVQGWLQAGQFDILAMRSPSVQLFLNEEEVILYDITEQILSGDSVHEGNESPPPYLAENPAWRAELLRQAGEAGKWLHSQGYRGTGSADFLLTEKEGGEFEVYVCELNARVTGATYPSVLAHHFMPDGCWLLRNLRFTEPGTGKQLLDLLKTSRDLYIPYESEFGIVPVNFNFGPDGLIHKGQFLCLAPSSGGSKMLLNMAKLDLPCLPDRD